METNTYVKKKSYEIKRISHEEGMVLRTMLNRSDESIKETLLRDDAYWSDELTIEEALKIGIEIRNQIFEMVEQ